MYSRTLAFSGVPVMWGSRAMATTSGIARATANSLGGVCGPWGIGGVVAMIASTTAASSATSVPRPLLIHSPAFRQHCKPSVAEKLRCVCRKVKPATLDQRTVPSALANRAIRD